MASFTPIAAIILGAFGLAFLVHLLSKQMSKKFAAIERPDEERRSNIGEQLIYYSCKWVSIVFLCWFGLNALTFWPPHWLERMQQRKIVALRAEEAGGWEVIKQDCNGLARSNAEIGFQWFRDWHPTNSPSLPKSLLMLQPRAVELRSEINGMESVQIQIFGGHATGLRGTDFYILKVICPPPHDLKKSSTADPNAKVQYGDRKIVDGVYEVTRHS